LVEYDPLARQAIDRRGIDEPIPCETDVTPAHVIDQDENDVRVVTRNGPIAGDVNGCGIIGRGRRWLWRVRRIGGVRHWSLLLARPLAIAWARLALVTRLTLGTSPATARGPTTTRAWTTARATATGARATATCAGATSTGRCARRVDLDRSGLLRIGAIEHSQRVLHDLVSRDHPIAVAIELGCMLADEAPHGRSHRRCRLEPIDRNFAIGLWDVSRRDAIRFGEEFFAREHPVGIGIHFKAMDLEPRFARLISLGLPGPLSP
jgi:hypothetical protein